MLLTDPGVHSRAFDSKNRHVTQHGSSSTHHKRPARPVSQIFCSRVQTHSPNNATHICCKSLHKSLLPPTFSDTCSTVRQKVVWSARSDDFLPTSASLYPQIPPCECACVYLFATPAFNDDTPHITNRLSSVPWCYTNQRPKYPHDDTDDGCRTNESNALQWSLFLSHLTALHRTAETRKRLLLQAVVDAAIKHNMENEHRHTRTHNIHTSIVLFVSVPASGRD